MVSDSSLTCMVVAAVISFGAPVVVLVVARRRLHVQFRAVLVGALVFIVFAGLLEQLAHALAFSAFPGLRSTPVAFVLYGALAAGVFEELDAAAGSCSCYGLRRWIMACPAPSDAASAMGDRGHADRGPVVPLGSIGFSPSGQLLVGMSA
jgi:hypothetical protein